MNLRMLWNEILSELMDRLDMPQVSKDDMPEAFKILNDMGISVSMKSVLPKNLKHSQSKVNIKKIQNIVKDIKFGKKMPPIVISNDEHIVDGHHRQLAYKALGNKPMKAVMIDLPRDQAIIAYKQVENLIEN